MTAVGAIVGLGLAKGSLNEALIFTIVSAWLVVAHSCLTTDNYDWTHLDLWIDCKS